MASAKSLVEFYSRRARLNYERDGHLMPLLGLLDADGDGLLLMLMNQPELDLVPRDHVRLVLAATAAHVPKLRYVLLIQEAWVRSFPPTPDMTRTHDAWAAGFQYGDLEKLHEAGDAEVHTAAVVMVFDRYERHHTMMENSMVRDEHPPGSVGTVVARTVDWEVTQQRGWPEGAMADAVDYGLDRAVDTGAGIDPVLTALIGSGLVATVVQVVTDG